MATTLRVGSGVFSTFRSTVAEPPLSPGMRAFGRLAEHRRGGRRRHRQRERAAALTTASTAAATTSASGGRVGRRISRAPFVLHRVIEDVLQPRPRYRIDERDCLRLRRGPPGKPRQAASAARRRHENDDLAARVVGA